MTFVTRIYGSDRSTAHDVVRTEVKPRVLDSGDVLVLRDDGSTVVYRRYYKAVLDIEGDEQ